VLETRTVAIAARADMEAKSKEFAEEGAEVYAKA
jgi:hypothetical protein